MRRTLFRPKALPTRALVLVETILGAGGQPRTTEGFGAASAVLGAKVPARAFGTMWSTEMLGAHAAFHAVLRRSAFRALPAMHHRRWWALVTIGTTKSVFSTTTSAEVVLASAWAFRAVHLGTAWVLAEILRRPGTVLIGAEVTTRTFATRLMVVVRTSGIPRALLAAGRFVTWSFRTAGVVVACASVPWHVISASRIWTALGLRTPAAGFGAFGIATLGLGAASLGIAAGGFLAAFGAGSRRIGAAGFRRGGLGRRFGCFLRRKRRDAEGAEAQQHETMAGCGFHGLELGC